MSANLPREPLCPEERALADALARLPAVEPAPTLDARVLAQAQEALESRPHAAPRRCLRPWWLSASLGTAAAAVLAAGVAWQTGIFDIGTGSSVPVPRSRAPMADTSDTREAVDVDLKHRAAPKPPSQDEAEIAAAVQPAAPPAPPPPAPASAPADVRDNGAPATSSPKATPVMQEPAPPAAPPPPARAEAARERSAMAQEGITSDAISVSGARLDPDTGAPLPHWREDARLEPDAWLERVRERLLRGDRPGAVQSLRQFQHKNPSRKVPDDLVRLLAG